MSEQETREYRWISPKSHDHCIDGERIEVVTGDVIELTDAQASQLKGKIKLVAVEQAEEGNDEGEGNAEE
jgi:uncharacterized protein YndB with AHSA1/START domain